MEKFVTVGRLGKVHGLDGFLRMQLEKPFLEDIAQAGVLFAGHPKMPVPYFIAEIKGGSALLVRFEDIHSREEASLLSGQVVYLRQSEVSATKNVDRDNPYMNVKGAQLIDVHLGTVGPIVDVQEYPQQIMAIVQYQDSEVMVPLNDQFVLRIDSARQEVHTDLPDGLFAV